LTTIDPPPISSSSSSDPSRQRVRPLGFILFAVTLCASLPPLLAGSSVLDRPFWLDEILTYWIASQPDVRSVIRTVASGTDTNPPALHLLLHLIGNTFGHTPTVYRITTLILTGLLASGLYLLVRRRAPASIALLAVAILLTPQALRQHAFDARFYILLLTSSIYTIIFLESLDRTLTSPDRTRSRIQIIATSLALIGSSAILCTVHYFGIVALASIVIGFLCFDRSSLRARLFALTPTLAGPLALLVCLPILLAQRNALADVGGTHLVRMPLQAITTALTDLLPPTLLLAVVLPCIVLRLAQRRRQAKHASSTSPDTSPDSSSVSRSIESSQQNILRRAGPVVGLLLYPLAIILFDLLIQPALLTRYLLPVALPIAILLALFVEQSTHAPLHRLRVAITFLLLGLIAFDLLSIRLRTGPPGPLTSRGIVELIPPTDGQPIISDWRGIAVPIFVARPDLRRQLRYLDDPSILDFYPHDTHLRAALPFETKMLEINRKHFDVPPRIDRLTLNRLETFLLITHLSPGDDLPRRFPGFTITQVGPIHFQFTRTTTTTTTPQSTHPPAP
jgi:hypothetical protein